MEKKRTKIKGNINKLPDNVDLLVKLKNEKKAVGIPDKDYDDTYMIEYAR